MSSLSALRAAGLSINWGTLYLGLSGDRLPGSTIAPDEAFRCGLELAGPPEIGEVYMRFVSASPLDTAELVSSLLGLASLEGADLDVEARKWRLVLLEQLLEQLPDEPIPALTALTDFWNDFDFPADSPHVVQGRGNQLDPRSYYTAAQRDELLARHRSWIHTERDHLQKAG